MTNLSYVKVVRSDEIVLVNQLACEIWPEYYRAIVGIEQVKFMLGKFQSAEAIKEQISEGYRYYLVMFKNEAIGYFAILPRKDQELFLSKLYLKAVHRGKGFGRQAVEFIESLAKKGGLKEITLTVNKKNVASICFYERCGFVKTSSVVKDIGAGFVMDDHVFSKDI